MMLKEAMTRTAKFLGLLNMQSALISIAGMHLWKYKFTTCCSLLGSGPFVAETDREDDVIEDVILLTS